MSKKSTIYLMQEDLAKLQDIAKRLGYVATRGAGAVQGSGSASSLIQAIARGEAVVLPNARTDISQSVESLYDYLISQGWTKVQDAPDLN